MSDQRYIVRTNRTTSEEVKNWTRNPFRYIPRDTIIKLMKLLFPCRDDISYDNSWLYIITASHEVKTRQSVDKNGQPTFDTYVEDPILTSYMKIADEKHCGLNCCSNGNWQRSCGSVNIPRAILLIDKNDRIRCISKNSKILCTICNCMDYSNNHITWFNVGKFMYYVDLAFNGSDIVFDRIGMAPDVYTVPKDLISLISKDKPDYTNFNLYQLKNDVPEYLSNWMNEHLTEIKNDLHIHDVIDSPTKTHNYKYICIDDLNNLERLRRIQELEQQFQY